MKYLHLYNNLTPLTLFNTNLQGVRTSSMMLSEILVYELWFHNDISDIGDLNFLISNSRQE